VDKEISAHIGRLERLVTRGDAVSIRELVRISNELVAHANTQNFALLGPILVSACSACFNAGSLSDAIKLGKQVAEVAVKAGDVQAQRKINNILGVTFIDVADFAEAMRCLQTAVKLARDLGDPFLEAACLANVVTLMQEMGHYRQAISLAKRIAANGQDSDLIRALRLQSASSGLFAAHRIGDNESAEHFALIGRENLPFANDVGRAFFEKERAVYLIAAGQSLEASHFVETAYSEIGQTENRRVTILLGLSRNLCAWASGEKEAARHTLRTMYEDSKRSRLYHNLVLQALIKVYGDAETSEDVTSGLQFARELVEFTTSVKKAKFYRQLANKREQRDASGLQLVRSEIDPFATVRDWLTSSEITSPPEESGGNVRREVAKHEELTAIHDDMARLRVASIRREIRTDAVSTAENWAIAAEFFDDETGKHCYRVGHLASLLARKIGMDDTFCFQIELAARLHDIGKIAVNEVILLKPGPLDAAEMAAMRLHTEVGAQILAGSDDPTLRMATDIARHHHEWWNGAGYPTKLAAKDIPIAARICAYSDVYDALTNVRAYKAAWTHERAIEEITRLSGTQFDPEFLAPFLDVLESYRRDLASDAIPGFADMDANALIASRKKLLETISEDAR
jgi:putative two-component system response regulator